MNWYFLLLFLHITSAIVFIGGVLARQLVRSNAKQTDDVRAFAALSQAAGRIENSMVITGNLAVVLFGVILALLVGSPILGFLQGASQNWLLVSNVLLVIMVLTVPLVFIPRGKQFGAVLEEALAEGRMTPELRAAMDDKVVHFAHIAEIIGVLIMVVLMVFKPF